MDFTAGITLPAKFKAMYQHLSYSLENITITKKSISFSPCSHHASREIKESHITKLTRYFLGAFSTTIYSPAIFVQLNIWACIFYEYNKRFYWLNGAWLLSTLIANRQNVKFGSEIKHLDTLVFHQKWMSTYSTWIPCKPEVTAALGQLINQTSQTHTEKSTQVVHTVSPLPVYSFKINPNSYIKMTSLFTTHF